MVEVDRVAVAEAEVERTREQLIDTLQGLASELEPKKLAREFWESAKNKGADLAEEAVDAVKNRPVAVGGLVAALAMFIARDPLKDAAKKMVGSKRTPSAKKADKEMPVPPPARRRVRAPGRATSKTEK